MTTEIAILGGGFAGVCTAHVVSALGHDVVLIDRSTPFPDLFRAEKIEPEQAGMLREIGLLQHRAPRADPIGTTLNYSDGRLTRFDTSEQYGISYGATVNSLREALPSTVERVTERVSEIRPDPITPQAVLADGTTVRARLIVLATGGSEPLVASLGLQVRREPDLRSLTFGFDIELVDCPLEGFRGLNYYLGANPDAVDYVTIFPIGARMRVNLFTQLEPKAPQVERFRADPMAGMRQFFPDLPALLGPIRALSRVRIVPTTFHRIVHPELDGIAIVGEEVQSVSPTTGRGLSRVLTDVRVLCSRFAPEWLAGRGIDASAIRSFYRDAEKVESDRIALDTWVYYQNRQFDRVPLTLRLRQKLLSRTIEG